MMYRSTLGGAAAVVLLSQTAAFADVTAEQVWQDWQAQATGNGTPLTADSVDRQGDTLVVSGMRFRMDADGNGSDDISGALAEIRFQELGDGTVQVTMSPEFEMVVDQQMPDAPDISYAVSVDMAGMATIASGDDSQRQYDYTAPSVGMSMTRLSVGGEPIDGTASATITGLGGSTTLTNVAEGEPRQVDATTTMDSVTFDIAFADPAGSGEQFSMTGSVADIAGTSASTLLDSADLADIGGMLAAGLSFAGNLTSGAASYSANVDGPNGQNFSSDVTAGAGTLDFALDVNGITYGGSNSDVVISVSGSDIPFPEIRVTAAEMGGRLTMPITASDVPQDMGLGLVLRDLAVSEMIWAMADPAGVLPHDPATLIIDTAGTANWSIDILSPDAQENLLAGGAPGQLHSLDLRDLQLSFAGAALKGAGAFIFDNSDTSTYPGMPKPVGKVNLSIDGANALLDKLIAMGLIPAEQALGFRGMMGMFARPGEAPDSLVSEIELTPDGGISANGLRLR